MSTTITRATVWEDGEATNMARVVGTDAANIAQADLTGVTYAVYQGTTEIVAPAALTVSNVVFDTLQTDAKWTVDSTGYNFSHQVAASVLSSPDVIYRVEYKFTFTDTTVTFAVFELYTKAVVQS